MTVIPGALVEVAVAATPRGKADFWDVDDDGKALGGVGPLFSPRPWDVVFLGEDPLPGICEVKGLPTLSFDKKKPNGGDSATITLNGYLPSPFEVDCKMWTAEQWDWFQVILPKFWRKPNKKVTGAALKTEGFAVNISHPSLQPYGINAVVIVGISPPERAPELGARIVRIKCEEFVEPSKAKRTATVTRFQPKADPRFRDPASPAGAMRPDGERK